MKVEQFRGVLEKVASMHGPSGHTQKGDLLRLLAENLASFDRKTVKMFVKQHHEKATRAKSAK